jgi:hypothetical protein
LPVVNIGQRQAGRVRGRNVLDAEDDQDSILGAIRSALRPEFRASLQGAANPYSTGREAAPAIVQVLRDIPLDQQLISKRFYDLPISGPETRLGGS